MWNREQRRDAVVRSEAKLEDVELKDDRRVRTEGSFSDMVRESGGGNDDDDYNDSDNGYNLSYITDEDMSNKISKFIKITGVINAVFKSSHVQKHTRLKVYKTLARPVLTYGSEAWTIRKADEQRLTTAEMRFMRRTAGCSLLEHRKNVDILQELKMDPIVNFVQQYRLQWKKHVERMDRTRWPKQILTYVPRGKRKLGRPRKRWHEIVTDPVGSNT
ncbi:hypothetical protein ANN_05216 [Periplaneta americana]|uniref:Uncharacterized protein n=1 Tax=Periplaneta americana TaxID=6978 RepID=A0ABQ8TBD4_PERAM|nr:hypothetical protein ANN_05216 [Periplaneta americana]